MSGDPYELARQAALAADTIPPPPPPIYEAPQSVEDADAEHLRRAYDTTPAFVMTWPPGVTGRLAYETYLMMPYPNQTLAIASAIAEVAGYAQRSYHVNGMGVNIYIMTPLETGGSKESLVKATNRLETQLSAHLGMNVAVAAGIHGPTSFASEPAIYKHMSNAPRQKCIFNEASFLFEDMSQSDSHGSGKKKALLDMRFKSGVDGRIQPHVHSKKEDSSGFCIMPSLTVIAEGQPERFYGAIDEVASEDGLLSRFNVWDSTRNWRGPFNEKMAREFSVELVTALSPLVKHAATHNGFAATEPTLTEVCISPEAHGRLRAYRTEVMERLSRYADRLRYNLFNRSDAQAWTIAATLAIADNHAKPIIGDEHMKWALVTVFAERSMLHHKFVAGEIGRGDEQRVSRLIIALQERFPTSTNSRLTSLGRRNGYVAHGWFLDMATGQQFTPQVGKGKAQLVADTIGLLIADGVMEVAAASTREQHNMRGIVYKVDSQTLMNRYRRIKGAS